ncbi:hypothetical protein Tco_1553209 [Tanacetum coccineum]
MRKQQVLDLVLGGNQRVEFSRLFVLDGFQPERYSPLTQQRYIVQSYKGRTQSLVAEKTDISENRASRNFDLMINTKTFDHSRSSLGLHGNDALFLNVQLTSVHISSGLVLHQMTSAHNRSELRIQDHNNEQSSSKLVPRVVP